MAKQTRYYIAHADDNSPAVYQVDGEYLAHTVPDWEQIEQGPSRIWHTTDKREAYNVADRLRQYGARVVAYRA